MIPILILLKSVIIPKVDLLYETNCWCGITCLSRWRETSRPTAARTGESHCHARPLRGADRNNQSRSLLDNGFLCSAYGGEDHGPSPVDRRKSGSEHHLITDASGIALDSSVMEVNVDEIIQLAPLFNYIAPVAGKLGHPPK